MADDIDIRRSAQLFIDKHEDLAEIEAAIKAREMMVRGDLEGYRTWLRVVTAIAQMRTSDPPARLI